MLSPGVDKVVDKAPPLNWDVHLPPPLCLAPVVHQSLVTSQCMTEFAERTKRLEGSGDALLWLGVLVCMRIKSQNGTEEFLFWGVCCWLCSESWLGPEGGQSPDGLSPALS